MANNVIIRNVRVLGTSRTAIEQLPGYKGLVMDRIEVIGQYKDGDVIDAYDQAIYGQDGWTLRNSRISGYPDGAKLHRDTLVENNYFFNNSRTFDSKGREKHVDGLQSMGGENVIIRNNTFVADSRPGGDFDMASNLMIQNDKAQVVNYLVEGNRFSGGSYSTQFNSFKTDAGPHTKVVVRNNIFAGLAPKGYAQYGPIRIGVATDDITVQGNVFADDSGVVTKIADKVGSGTTTSPEPTVLPTTEPPVDPPATNPASLLLKGLTAGQTVSGTVSLEAIPADAPNLAGVDFYLDDKLVNTQKTAPICLYDDNGTTCTPYDISAVPNGSHTFKAVMRYGTNQTVTQSVTVNVQNISTPTPTPTATVTPSPTTTVSPPPPITPSPTPTTDTTPPTAPTNVKASLSFNALGFKYESTLKWAASYDTGAGMQDYLIRRNGTDLGATTALSFKDANITANTVYNYEVFARDKSGNISAPGTARLVGRCFLIWCWAE